MWSSEQFSCCIDLPTPVRVHERNGLGTQEVPARSLCAFCRFVLQRVARDELCSDIVDDERRPLIIDVLAISLERYDMIACDHIAELSAFAARHPRCLIPVGIRRSRAQLHAGQ